MALYGAQGAPWNDARHGTRPKASQPLNSYWRLLLSLPEPSLAHALSIGSPARYGTHADEHL